MRPKAWANRFQIVGARLPDAALLAGLQAACFDGAHQRPWDEAAMAQFIAGPSTLCLIGIGNGIEAKPAGLLIARAAADEAELLTIGVLPPARQLGLGRALLRHAADALRGRGIARLFLEVDEGNGPAIMLYESLGASPVGRRPGYYEDGADAAVYSLDLGAQF